MCIFKVKEKRRSWCEFDELTAQEVKTNVTVTSLNRIKFL